MIHAFKRAYDLFLLLVPTLSSPPSSPDIPLMWCMGAHSTRSTTNKSYGTGVLDHISLTTVYHIWTAPAQYYQWGALVSHPSAAWLTKERRLLYQVCCPTDGVSMTMFGAGLLSCMRNLTTLSRVLSECHVVAVDHHWSQVYNSTKYSIVYREVILGGLTNVLFWLGWLRLGEFLSSPGRIENLSIIIAKQSLNFVKT